MTPRLKNGTSNSGTSYYLRAPWIWPPPYTTPLARALGLTTAGRFVIPGSTNSWQVVTLRALFHAESFSSRLLFPPCSLSYLLPLPSKTSSFCRVVFQAPEPTLCCPVKSSGASCTSIGQPFNLSRLNVQRQSAHSDKIFSWERRRAAGAQQGASVLRRRALIVAVSRRVAF
jgi:hypothetical protein